MIKKGILKVLFSTCMLLMLYSVPAMAAEATTVTVGGTTLNKGEYLKKDFTQGSATDYNFYFSGGKLILNDAEGIGSIHADGDLKLELSGSSSVSDGIFVDGDLNIDGDGILAATATSMLAVNVKTYGIKANCLTINNGTITANGGGCDMPKCYDYAIYADTVIINGGLTTVNGAYSNSVDGYTYGIYAVTSVTVNSGTLNVYGGNSSAAITKSSAVSTGSFTVNNNSVVNIKGGDFFAAGRHGYGLESPNIVLNGGTTILECGYNYREQRNAYVTSSIPDIRMELGMWKDSPEGEYFLVSTTPYAPGRATRIKYLKVKPMDIVVIPQLQVNSTTGEWEVSYDKGRTWQSLGVAATGANGTDATTPQISIGADNCWQVSYDNGNTWTSLNAKVQGADGTNGTDGVDGRNGTDGTNGVDGRNGTDGVNGRDGKNGTNGADGKNGANGLTPYIGSNGNWYIGDTDTGVAATGKDGKDGKNGVDGKDGVNGADGKDGQNGADGQNGIYISSVDMDTEGCLIVTLTDGSTVNAGPLPTKEKELAKLKTVSTVSMVITGISLAGIIASALQLLKRKK